MRTVEEMIKVVKVYYAICYIKDTFEVDKNSSPYSRYQVFYGHTSDELKRTYGPNAKSALNAVISPINRRLMIEVGIMERPRNKRCATGGPLRDANNKSIMDFNLKGIPFGGP